MALCAHLRTVVQWKMLRVDPPTVRKVWPRDAHGKCRYSMVFSSAFFFVVEEAQIPRRIAHSMEQGWPGFFLKAFEVQERRLLLKGSECFLFAITHQRHQENLASYAEHSLRQGRRRSTCSNTSNVGVSHAPLEVDVA